jgi:hypothetical protein
LLTDNAVANGGEQYLCITEMATGFSYDKQFKKWVTSNFAPGAKYIISRRGQKPDSSFEVIKLGQKHTEMTCEESGKQLFCGYGAYQLQFNRDNGRFMVSFLLGYVAIGPLPDFAFPNDESSTTPNISIGTCSPF